MTYADPELLDRLAAAYVLGSLRGLARRRFERLCASRAAALEAVHRWEDRLLALNRVVEPVWPSARVWATIERQIAGASNAGAPQRSLVRGWHLAAASVAAVVLLFGLLQRLPAPALQTVAVLGVDSMHPLWRIERRPEPTTLTITTVGRLALSPEQAYELWALPRGGPPVSLGLLPGRGAFERPLTAVQRAALLAADRVAVSIEPAGGSPTGSPTGRVIIVATITTPG